MHLPMEAHLEGVYKILGISKDLQIKVYYLKKYERKEVEIITDTNWIGSAKKINYCILYFCIGKLSDLEK